MCGIAGYRADAPPSGEVLRAMIGALEHRGPDAEGQYCTRGFAAGMRRLSINDLQTGDQPLFNEDRSVVLLYNGEIYNHRALRADLESKGHLFATQSDGEVLCHLYEQYGESLFERVDGMFAAALWSEQERKLMLARDIPGEKPLYYALISDTHIAFASEIKSLAKYPGVDLSFDQQALWDFPTFLWVPEPRTVYRGIHALPRGHLLIVDERGARLEPIPNRFNPGELALTSDRMVIDETRRVVSEAVRSRLLSDVPVGCFLSSGLDSSIVTTVAASELSDLSTFTVGFEDIDDGYHGSANEAAFAESYASRLGTRHHTIHVTADDFRRRLTELAVFGDQPFGVSSALGVLSVAEAANQAGIKVMLTGDGADECFGGYSWYQHLPALVAHAGAGGGGEQAESELSFQATVPLGAVIDTVGRYPPAKRAWALHYYASESDKARLYNPEFFDGAAIQASARHFTHPHAGGIWSEEDYITHDRGFYFPNEMLRKVDRMTMAHSVEGRAPFAAPSVLAHAAKLRYSHMVRDGSLKWALRRAFADLLPPDIVARPKHGFNVPVDAWLASSWSDLIDETFAPDSPLFQTGMIGKGSAAAAHAMIADTSNRNGHTIFCFIMLNLWLRHR